MSKRLIGFVIFIAIAGLVSECSSANRNTEGVITESGDIDAFETKVKDCLVELPGNSETDELVEFTSLEAVPCNEPHKWQVVYKGFITDFEEYSVESIDLAANKICDDALALFINSLSESKLNEYKDASTTFIAPTEKSWTREDRTVDCLIGSDAKNYFTSIFE